MDALIAELHKKLIEPFPANAISWKPQAISKTGDKALAVAYIDARDVMDRLDFLVGMEGWEDEYTDLAGGAVMCKLTIHVVDSQGYRVSVSRSDVGGMSDQPDPGDKKKAAFSDALKRAAVKFGIGRYLYGLENRWYKIKTYDANGKKHFDSWVDQPQLPAWALPPAQPKAPPPAARAAAQQPAAAPPAQAGKPNPVTKSQVDMIDALFKIAIGELKMWTQADVDARLEKACGKADPWALTSSQADNIIAAVSEVVKSKGIELPKP